jgi:hypothetical protein
MRARLGLKLSTIGMSLIIVGLAVGVKATLAAQLPPSTTIPIVFERTIDASKAKTGDMVRAKTMQAVSVSGVEIAKGAILSGHVVEARPFVFDQTHYAVQKASYLSIHFDQIVDKGVTTPLNVSVRALANYREAYEASHPHYLDETDSLGTMVLIGGDQYSPIGKELRSSDDEDIVGYIRKEGVFAHPLPSDYHGQSGSFLCNGTDTEQAMGIFSASACGLYGFSSLSMTENGGDQQPGTFRLESRHYTVKLYAGSAALLQAQ